MSLPEHLRARFTGLEPLVETAVERVFAAHDEVLQRDVRIKLPAAVADGWSAPVKERLLREARALAKVQHPNVTPLLWVEQTDEGPLCVLPAAEGVTLAEHLGAERLDVDEALRIGVDIAEALHAVHYQGVVHRGVGTAAIRVLPSGGAQLDGFTFAKDFGNRLNNSSLAHGALHGDAAQSAGLPEFSAPEQLAGSGSEPRSDVYALGCTLYRCLAGAPPFADGARDAPAPDVRRARKDVPKALAQVVRTCCQYSRQQRYATARELADALRAVQATRGGGAPARGAKGAWIAAAAAAALVAVGTWVFAEGPWSSPASTRGEYAPPDPTAVAQRYEARYGDTYAQVHGLFVAIGDAYAGGPKHPLATPRADAEAVIARLRRNDEAWRRDGAIVALYDGDATQDNVLQALDQLEQRAGRDDGVLIYFAGHAERHGRTFGLCCADCGGDVRAGGGYVMREALLTAFDRLDAKHVLAVLDCCHSGAMFDGAARGRDDEPRAGDENPGAHHLRNFSRELLASCGGDQLASDGDGHSPFCRLLLQELDRPATAARRYVAARYLSAHIRERMDDGGARAANLQVPNFRQLSEQVGSFVFRLAPE